MNIELSRRIFELAHSKRAFENAKTAYACAGSEKERVAFRRHLLRAEAAYNTAAELVVAAHGGVLELERADAERELRILSPEVGHGQF